MAKFESGTVTLTYAEWDGVLKNRDALERHLKKLTAASDSFLDTDHTVSLDFVVNIINQEIQWCYQNPLPNSEAPAHRNGFISGLEQAKFLIIMGVKESTQP